MRLERALPALILLAAIPAFSADAPPTAIRCGRLLDPASGQVRENAVIVVRGERVEQVGARRWRRDVAAHAYGGEGAKNAIRAGVRSIEHGMLLDDEALDLMVRHGTWWCPTLSVYFPDSEEELTDLRKRILASHKEVFQKAMRKGVKIAFGTDVGAYEHGTSAKELSRMVEYGMSPLDAIRSATVRGAELLRMEKEIGTVEPGKYADVIAVEGDPLQDIGVLGRVAFVMKAGTVYKRP